MARPINRECTFFMLYYTPYILLRLPIHPTFFSSDCLHTLHPPPLYLLPPCCDLRLLSTSWHHLQTKVQARKKCWRGPAWGSVLRLFPLKDPHACIPHNHRQRHPNDLSCPACDHHREPEQEGGLDVVHILDGHLHHLLRARGWHEVAPVEKLQAVILEPLLVGIKI